MKRFALATCVLVAMSAANAAPAPERFDQLTLEQAVQTALQNHRSLRVSQASIDMAEAHYQQAMAAFRPKNQSGGGVSARRSGPNIYLCRCHPDTGDGYIRHLEWRIGPGTWRASPSDPAANWRSHGAGGRNHRQSDDSDEH